MNGERGRIGLFISGTTALAGVLVLLGLGTWQLERRSWKEGLIETLERRMALPPVELPPAGEWAALTPGSAEFRRVRLRVELIKAEDALVYTGASSLRDDFKSPGYFVFSPARLSSGQTVAINRGYAPNRSYPKPSDAMDIVGVIRFPETPSMFVAEHDRTTWFVRDHLRMASVLNWGAVAPFYIEQESPVPSGGVPHPASLKPRLRNDHLQYALTWYSLAVVLAAVFVIWTLQRRRRPAP